MENRKDKVKKTKTKRESNHVDPKLTKGDLELLVDDWKKKYFQSDREYWDLYHKYSRCEDDRVVWKSWAIAWGICTGIFGIASIVLWAVLMGVKVPFLGA